MVPEYATSAMGREQKHINNKKSKTLMKKLLMLAMALTMSLPLLFTSCSDDDDDTNGGSGSGSSKVSLKIDGQKADFGYIYWNTDPENSHNGKTYYQLEFWSFDFYGGKIPSKMSMFVIGFYADGSERTLPTGTFSNYDLSGALNASQSDPEGLYFEEDESKSGKLIISKDGGNYSITIDPLYILSGNDEAHLTTTPTSLKYTGKLPKAPRQSWDD